MKKVIYLDQAAFTPIGASARRAMLFWLAKKQGNPSALHQWGVLARRALEENRAAIANVLGAPSDTIIFTGGGTESNNLAIFGVTGVFKKPGHIITTPIEHSSVRAPLLELKKQGWKITVLPVDRYGLVNASSAIGAVKPDTVLISVMYANNEVGAVEPIAAIGAALARQRQKYNTKYPYFHTDACQAALYFPLQVEKLHVDLLTLNGAKIYGPSGTGILYARRGVNLRPMFFGGGQERGRRAGTENVAGVAGLGAALIKIPAQQKKEIPRLANLTRYFWQEIKRKIPAAVLNGPPLFERRLPNNLSVTLPEVDGETLLLYLDQAGIACATGSACSTDSADPSPVLAALGVPADLARSTLRFSLGKQITRADLNYAVRILTKYYAWLRLKVA